MKSVVHERMHSRAACTSACSAEAERLLLLRLADLHLAAGAEEVAGEPVEEAARVGLEGALVAGDRGVVEGAVGVVGVERQAGRDRGREHRAVHAVGTVGAEVARHLAAAHREADEGDVAQVEPVDHRCEVAGEGVVVVGRGVARLVALAEAAAVVGDHPVAGIGEGGQLARPGLTAERPAVHEDDGAAVAAAVLDVEVHRTVADRGHRRPFASGAGSLTLGTGQASNQREVHSIPVV